MIDSGASAHRCAVEQDRVKQRDEQVEVIQATLRQTLDRLESTSSEVCGAATYPARVFSHALPLFRHYFMCLFAECFCAFAGSEALVEPKWFIVVYCGAIQLRV